MESREVVELEGWRVGKLENRGLESRKVGELED